MKKGTLTLEKMTKLYNSLVKAEEKAKEKQKKMGKLIGYIGGVPVRANKLVPGGVIYTRSKKGFWKMINLKSLLTYES